MKKEIEIKEVKREFYTLTNAFLFKKNIKQNFTKLYDFMVALNIVSFLIMIFTFNDPSLEENHVKIFWFTMTLLLLMVNIYHYYISSLSNKRRYNFLF